MKGRTHSGVGVVRRAWLVVGPAGPRRASAAGFARRTGFRRPAAASGARAPVSDRPNSSACSTPTRSSRRRSPGAQRHPVRPVRHPAEAAAGDPAPEPARNRLLQQLRQLVPPAAPPDETALRERLNALREHDDGRGRGRATPTTRSTKCSTSASRPGSGCSRSPSSAGSSICSCGRASGRAGAAAVNARATCHPGKPEQGALSHPGCACAAAA